MRSLLLMMLFFMSHTAASIEEPKYRLIEADDKFELREYESKIIAHVTVTGSMKKASNKGFRLIADYIFGNNSSTVGQDKEKIAMTAPVIVQPKSEKIAMTAPVLIQSEDDQWQVSFVMPSEYTMDSLPKPNNDKVSITEIPAKKYAVVRFSGLVGQKKLDKKTQALMTWLESKGIQAKGIPELARYNPPWVLPFLRRNEIMVPY